MTNDRIGIDTHNLSEQEVRGQDCMDTSCNNQDGYYDTCKLGNDVCEYEPKACCEQ